MTAPGSVSPAALELDEGWGIARPRDRAAHYYRAAMSLCRRVGPYSGLLYAEEFLSKDHCAACQQALAREREPGA